ncbi:hypothetical protein QTP86_006728 [Hemibagrus guttatus]|nr:hypothetical protein QTP86_006728 [Hemibagrus guttatus]
MAPRNARGWRPPTSWIHRSWRISTATIRTGPLHAQGGAPGVEPQEVFLEGGALSRLALEVRLQLCVKLAISSKGLLNNV